MPAALLLLLAGCSTLKGHHKDLSGLRIHGESESAATGGNESITVIRSHPVVLNIVREPLLSESDVTAARLLDVPGGFAVQVQFEETSAWALEQWTATNPGKHLAIFGQWGKKPVVGRWLAAPLITRRLAGGSLVFTPDASREEMEALVKGLNNVAKENAGIRSKD
ncbi:MAG TPA: hypothetical protein VF988_16300 [Verrucomicrobiae bacterium]